MLVGLGDRIRMIKLGYAWLSAPGFGRKLLFWTPVCFLSAAPSAVLGLSGNFDPTAIFLCIIVCTLIYAAVADSNWMRNVLEQRFVRLTLRIGFWTRIICCIVFPAAVLIDMIVGIVSVAPFFGMAVPDNELFRQKDFTLTLVVGISHTLMLHLVLLAYMGVIYLIQRSAASKQVPAGHCQHCQYDLTGNVSGVCPECGNSISNTVSVHKVAN